MNHLLQSAIHDEPRDQTFDYVHPSVDELAPFIGRNWVIARQTDRILRQYGPTVNCLSPAAYEAAVVKAIAARGYARPVEKVISDLIRLAGQLLATQDGGPQPEESTPEFAWRLVRYGRDVLHDMPAVRAARAALQQSRKP